MQNILYSTCMQHSMPQSLIVFAASSTRGNTQFETIGGVAHPIENFDVLYFYILNVYIHIIEIQTLKKS